MRGNSPALHLAEAGEHDTCGPSIPTPLPGGGTGTWWYAEGNKYLSVNLCVCSIVCNQIQGLRSSQFVYAHFTSSKAVQVVMLLSSPVVLMVMNTKPWR